MRHCTYGSTECGNHTPESTHQDGTPASSLRINEQNPPSTRIRVLVSSLFIFATAFALMETLHLSPMKIETFRDEKASLLQDTSDNFVVDSISSSIFSAAEQSSSFEVFRWRKVYDSDGSYYVGYLEFCNIGNDTFFYRTARSATVEQGGNASFVPCEKSTSTVSPVIRMLPRTNYKLILINRSNQPTNLHTHGFHVSGVGIYDDVRRTLAILVSLAWHRKLTFLSFILNFPF